MGINKIGSIEGAYGAASSDDNESTGDKAKRFESAREQDIKNTGLSRYAKDIGTTTEKLKKQGEINEKMGFGAIFLDKIEKNKK